MKKYIVTVKGISYEVMVEEVAETNDVQARPQAPVKPVVVDQPVVKKEEPAQPAKPVSTGTQGSKNLASPMPGTIVKIVAKPGDTVKKGGVLVVLEAMKMENDIVAPEDCTVASVNVTQGASVNSGDILVTFN